MGPTSSLSAVTCSAHATAWSAAELARSREIDHLGATWVRIARELGRDFLGRFRLVLDPASPRHEPSDAAADGPATHEPLSVDRLRALLQVSQGFLAAAEPVHSAGRRYRRYVARSFHDYISSPIKNVAGRYLRPVDQRSAEFADFPGGNLRPAPTRAVW
jgi:hypothetical protein